MVVVKLYRENEPQMIRPDKQTDDYVCNRRGKPPTHMYGRRAGSTVLGCEFDLG